MYNRPDLLLIILVLVMFFGFGLLGISVAKYVKNIKIKISTESKEEVRIPKIDDFTYVDRPFFYNMMN
jgi:hypothetical protein